MCVVKGLTAIFSKTKPATNDVRNEDGGVGLGVQQQNGSFLPNTTNMFWWTPIYLSDLPAPSCSQPPDDVLLPLRVIWELWEPAARSRKGEVGPR